MNTIAILKFALESRKEASATILGDSMMPFIKNSDVVTIVKAEKYNIGDIVLFEYDGILLSHRVLEIGSDTNGGVFFIKGDNSFRIEKTHSDRIIGKVIRINKKDPPKYDSSLIVLSLRVGKCFDELKRIDMVKKSKEYLTYVQKRESVYQGWVQTQ